MKKITSYRLIALHCGDSGRAGKSENPEGL
jgi:hypothetical protein